jgi:hypothetical protein
MIPARGDRKPCTVVGCKGMMQFGRRTSGPSPLSGAQPPAALGSAPEGWNCSIEPRHFRQTEGL